MDIGKLTAADEGLNHQIADTFATVAESDLGWTEKIWGAFVRKDGGISISFGLGKYQNRNVMDGFGGIAYGNEQRTVRVSRRLDSDMESASVGPLHYEIVEPLKKIRFRLDKNETQPIAFDILFEGELPPAFEERNRQRAGYRVRMDVVRYHQLGKVSGWVEIDGKREEVGENWFGARDHSWGMRGNGVGALPTDLQPSSLRPKQSRILWGPLLLQRPDGSKYQIINFLWSNDYSRFFSGYQFEADKNGELVETGIRDFREEVELDKTNRHLKSATFDITLSDNSTKKVEITVAGNTAFHLRTGGYGTWAGFRHGSWMGDYFEDGEHIEDVLAQAADLGQFRDVPVIVRVGDDVGFGIQEAIYNGVFPEMGLGEESDFNTYA